MILTFIIVENMKLLGVLCLITLSYCKIINMPTLDEFHTNRNNISDVYDENHNEDSKIHSNVWVLELNEWDSAVLRKANVEESRYFYSVAGPLIDQYENSHPASMRVKDYTENTQNRLKSHENITAMSAENVIGNIFKLLNKFDMYAKPDASPYLEDDNAFSLILFFQGPYISLIMKSGKQHFHYFLAPPSLLSNWYYEDLLNSTSIEQELQVQVPINIKKELLRLLQIILKHNLTQCRTMPNYADA